MDFIVVHDDMGRLEGIVTCQKLENSTSIAVFGFSTGGSYSMLLAANPNLKDNIGPVLLFSPIYDARAVADRIHDRAGSIHYLYKRIVS